MSKPLSLIGFASGIAGNNSDCALAPWYLYNHPEWFIQQGLTVSWDAFIKVSSVYKGVQSLPQVTESLQSLSREVLNLAQKQHFFSVIGGDHSCAIGTWSAVAFANRAAGDIGLIWIDAHMDSHIPATSPTQNIHGMPVAVLLGYGASALCQILDAQPKLKPHHVCLIGVRSYEPSERRFLEQLGVRIYYMEEVLQRGLPDVLQEAYHALISQTCGIGFSIDMDAIDPSDAPGVGYREGGGIKGEDLKNALRNLPKDKTRLLGIELTEYNPLLDVDNKTAYLLIDLLSALVS